MIWRMWIEKLVDLKHAWLARYQGVEVADPEALAKVYQESAILVFWLTALLHPHPVVTATDALAGLMLLLVRYSRPWLSLKARAWLTLIVIGMGATVSAWVFGGLSSIFMIWYFTIPVPFMVVLGQRALWLAVGAVCVLVSLTYALQTLDLLPSPPPAGADLRVPLVTMFLMVLSILAIPTTFYVVLQRTMGRQKRRNQELQETEAVLRQQRQQQDEFVASVSHELRTPMNAIIGFLETMDTQDMPSARNREMFGAMNHSAQHLMTVINDLLDFSQIQTGNLRITPQAMSLHELLHDVTLMFEAPLRERGIPLVLSKAEDLPNWIMGDADRITQVIINLLGNAAKFTRQGQVTLVAAREAPDRVRIEVQDTGCGIAEDQVAVVFERFSRLTDQTRREYGGTGLGLSISQHLVQLMGGHIGVRSTLNVGSVFWLELPVVEVAPPVRASAPQIMPSPRQLTEATILIVDDSLINRVVAKQMLSKDWPQAHIREASGGQAAVDAVAAGGITLVLMDVIMPEMDGLEATRRISALPQPVPVIGLTADITRSVHNACLDAGMVRVLTKPYGRAELMAAIQETLLQLHAEAA